MARITSRPAFTLASTASGPKGTATHAASAGMMAMIGPRRNSPLAAALGLMISLVSNLIASAIGCSRPNGPTRLGPRRTCMKPSSLRSHSVR
ncbi:hypothetical protein D9M68_919220 [compost metagenome]